MSLFLIDAGKEWRGGQRQVLFLARELRRAKYPFWLVVQRGGPLHKKADDEGLPLLPLKMRNEADLLAVLRLAASMRRRRCVLAHFNDAHGTGIGSRAAGLAKVPLRVISRRVDFPIKSKSKYTKEIDVIIAISESVKKVLVEDGIPSGLIEVIPSGTDFSPFEEVRERDFLRREFGFAPDDFLVGIVAQLEDHKGHRYLVEAAQILKGQAPKLRFIIVGGGSLRIELDRQAHNLHVDDVVYFLGFREDVPRILASLDLFVLSSHMEGLGSSLLDAMASRLPIVATTAGGIPEVVVNRETGLLVPPRDPPALAQAILKVYLDKTLAARLAQRGYEVVHEKFSAESMARQVIAAYERLAAKKGVRLGRTR
ncbi:MAG: glycosyltransferase family 4 protein [Candidatus Aminicenantes bacterium]|nr:glycosyltransferase family 4 protein [Candidatus Aminicenantes bacterium]